MVVYVWRIEMIELGNIIYIKNIFGKKKLYLLN